MRFAVYTPPQAAAGPGAGAVLPRRAHLHRRNVRDQGRRARARGAPRHHAGRARHEPARRAAGRSGVVGFRHRRRVSISTRRRRRGRSTTACTATSSTSCPRSIAANFKADVVAQRHHGPFDGRPWRADDRAQESGEVPVACRRSRRSPRRSRARGATKAFTGYLGAYRAAWSQYDATELVKAGHKFPGGILIDQGTADKFLADQLKPELLVAACKAAGQELDLQHARRLRPRLLLHPDLHRRSTWPGMRSAARRKVDSVVVALAHALGCVAGAHRRIRQQVLAPRQRQVATARTAPGR